ncbi:MAG: thiol reductase thioredoxin [Deltaproteobacteria bacterium]|nr:thiol reductase thioredoxin [Deltaproteobacteria bacterium]
MGWLKRLLGVEVEPVPVVSVNDNNFRTEVVESDLPVLLDVWSPTCVPCKQLEPIVIDLAKRYKGRLKVAEISTETGSRVLGSLGVRGTPTVIYFKKGREVERVVGLRGSLYHSEFIDNELLEDEGEAATAG